MAKRRRRDEPGYFAPVVNRIFDVKAEKRRRTEDVDMVEPQRDLVPDLMQVEEEKRPANPDVEMKDVGGVPEPNFYYSQRAVPTPVNIPPPRLTKRIAKPPKATLSAKTDQPRQKPILPNPTDINNHHYYYNYTTRTIRSNSDVSAEIKHLRLQVADLADVQERLLETVKKMERVIVQLGKKNEMLLIANRRQIERMNLVGHTKQEYSFVSIYGWITNLGSLILNRYYEVLHKGM